MPSINTESTVIDVTVPELTIEQSVPVVVASQTFNQTEGGNVDTTTLFTPSAAGVFRVSVYICWAAPAEAAPAALPPVITLPTPASKPGPKTTCRRF